MKVFAASFFALASALSIFHLANAKEFKVRVKNLTYQQPFSPPLLVAHTKDIAMFKEGAPASDEIKLMAETGDLSGLLELGELSSVKPYVCGAVVADVAIPPGGTWRDTMYVNETDCPNAVYSIVAMLVNTNDAFMGIDSSDLNFDGGSKVFPPAYDAGTEDNNEGCPYIPGPACPADSGNAEAGPGEEFIHVHRGFHGSYNLSAATYDWRNPVGEVFITPV